VSTATALSASDVEEKYKQVMMTNAQLDNDKQKLQYEVDLLKDRLADSEEHTTQLQQQLAQTSRVRQRHVGSFAARTIQFFSDDL